jgi:putative PIN family toxin of toxin-antitoxin system
MAARKIRVVLDTNWYISASINKNSRKTLYPLLIHPGLSLFYSQSLMEEYQRVIIRPFFKKHISHEQVARFMRMVLPILTKVELKSNVHISRDSNDDHVLNLATDAKAHYLVSADKDLLVLKKIGKARIVTMTEFIVLLSAKGMLQ